MENLTSSDIEQLINKLIIQFKLKVKNLAQQLPFQLYALLDTYFENAKPDDAWINAKVGSDVPAFDSNKSSFSSSKDKLFIRTGEYKKSFLAGNENTLTKISVTDTGYSVVFGSKLRRLHETGGFIRSKGKMQFWFFNRYKETKNEFFKIVGASVVKKGGVNVLKRQHLEPAFNELQSTGIKELTDDYLKQFSELLNKI